MAIRGNWGGRMVIHVPVLYKRVSCATCKHYCHEDHSCLILPIVPRKDGFDFWKNCKKFLLGSEYLDDAHKKQVMHVKGEGFFEEIQVIDCNEKIKCIKTQTTEINQLIEKEEPPAYVKKKAKTFSDEFLSCACQNHGIDFREISVPSSAEIENTKCYVSMRRKIVVMTMSKIKLQKVKHHINKEHIRVNRWTSFKNSLDSVIRLMDSLAVPDDFEKWIVLPEISYDEENSCGELFYYSMGKSLHGIKLVELDEDGRLQFATGPICEKFWNKERINEIDIFKNELIIYE